MEHSVCRRWARSGRSGLVGQGQPRIRHDRRSRPKPADRPQLTDFRLGASRQPAVVGYFVALSPKRVGPLTFSIIWLGLAVLFETLVF